MKQLVLFAVLLGLFFATLVVSRRLDVLTPKSRTWHNILFGVVVGAVFSLPLRLLMTNIVFSPVELVFDPLIGVLGGVFAAFVVSYFKPRSRRSGN